MEQKRRASEQSQLVPKTSPKTCGISAKTNHIKSHHSHPNSVHVVTCPVHCLLIPLENYSVPSAKAAAWQIGFAIKCLQPGTLRTGLAMKQYVQPRKEHTTIDLVNFLEFVLEGQTIRTVDKNSAHSIIQYQTSYWRTYWRIYCSYVASLTEGFLRS